MDNASLFDLRWGAGRHAATTASMKVADNDLHSALVRLDKRARYNPRLMKAAFWKAGKMLREHLARSVAAKTGLPIAGAKRRIRLRKARSPKNAFVAVSVAEMASVIHAGRLKLVQKGGRVASVKGVGPIEGGFLMNRKSWRGQKRRVYERVGKEVRAVAHPISVQDVFEQDGRHYSKLMARMALQELLVTQGTLARRLAGKVQGGAFSRISM